MISGSGLERGMNCPAAYALPRADRTGEDAIAGTANHTNIEAGLVVGGDLTKRVPWAVQKAMEGASEVDVEVAFALDVQTEMVRILGRRLGRNYGKLEASEIPLTVDAIITRPDGVWVWDWKSRERVTTAAHNLQLRAGMIAALKTKGLSQVHGGIGYLDDGEHDTTSVDVFDAATLFADLRAMMNKIGAARALVATGGTPDVHAGPWCKYCPAMAYCPAQTRLVKTMLGELEAAQQAVEFMTVEQVSKAWDLSKRIEKVLETVQESLRLRIQQSVIPRPNGKRLAMVEMPGRMAFDKEKAVARIRELGGQVDDLEKKGKPYYQVKEVKVAS